MIENFIKDGTKFDTEMFRKLQVDVTSLAAREFVATMKLFADEVRPKLNSNITKKSWYDDCC